MVENKPAADKPALSMLAESMPAQDKLAKDMPAQGKLVVGKLGEQHKRKLHQMEADSPAVIVINYVCVYHKKTWEWGMAEDRNGPAQGSVLGHGRPSMSGSIRPIKMYS